ncbi:MAG TPA: ABC transporter permease [Candidatus Acidoferrales bacterium]|nr:ABC transporter permease [Candidatus Acidoferrales bacterium]
MSVASLPLPSPPRKLKLRPKAGWQPIDFAELWHYRELLWILAKRDIQVRYKQTVLGILWAVIQPFAQMIVFTLLFAKNGFSTGGITPPLFYFSGSICWLLFASSLGNSGNSLTNNQNLITKVYFPRLVMPIASVLTAVVDFSISFLLLLALMGWYRTVPTLHLLFVPVFVLLALLASLSIGLWLSALNVQYRDVRYVINFMIQFWFFVTPVIYPSSIVKTHWKRIVLGINPMSGVVEGFRWCLFGKPAPSIMTAVSVITIFTLLVGGLFYFRRMEKAFADIV